MQVLWPPFRSSFFRFYSVVLRLWDIQGVRQLDAVCNHIKDSERREQSQAKTKFSAMAMPSRLLSYVKIQKFIKSQLVEQQQTIGARCM